MIVRGGEQMDGTKSRKKERQESESRRAKIFEIVELERTYLDVLCVWVHALLTSHFCAVERQGVSPCVVRLLAI